MPANSGGGNASWGGARRGAGRKKKSDAQKILEGKTPSSKGKKSGQKAVPFPEPGNIDSNEIGIDADAGSAICEISFGVNLRVTEIYAAVNNYLVERGCICDVPEMLIEQYAVAAARWEDIEQKLSGAPYVYERENGSICRNPLFDVAASYQKQSQNLMYQIIAIADKATEGSGANVRDDPMEKLLS